MRLHRTILALPMTAIAACGGPADSNLAADNVEFLPEEAMLNDVEGRRAAAGNEQAGGGKAPAVIPEPTAPPPPPPAPRKPGSEPPKTVPDARPIIDPPPVERPDIHVGHDMGNMANRQ